ncbi:MAG: hypothetical protein F6K40_06655 [Okeania sp. SIO3I5]|uniref:hypothetical protein n=1 Tax=Okeania sp. SIO3I5 TaxID=2607805 RepID=UPI0013BC8696|nr:hypothetical protein [Okeania sp. SIO3I5]NEQ35981.1 hypothetical protein [Okeania sp. SIO3I5]
MVDFNFNISSLTQGFNAGLKIAELTGFIESLNVKIDKLINSELNSGIKHLENSQRAKTIERKKFFVDEAYKCFTDARNMEKNERLFLAYIGYIYCLGCMNEKENMRVALKEFSCKHFQINIGSSKTFKEEVVDLFVSTIQYLPFNLENCQLFAKEVVLFARLFLFLLFIQYFNPQYLRLRIRYIRKKNVETFNELENRINFFQKRKIAHKQIIKIVKNSKTKQVEDRVKDSRKILMLIEKQMQIFELQKETYYYANKL